MATKLAGALSLPETERAELYVAISEWKKAADALAIAKDDELTKRLAIVERWFKQGTEEGTNTMPLEFGKALKVGITINRRVNPEQLEAVRAKAILEGSNVVVAAIEDAFRYKPELNIGAWKDLADDVRLNFADVVTESFGTPQVELATPKR